MSKTAADYQSTRRAKVKASGGVFLNIPIDQKAMEKLNILCAALNIVQRQAIEMLIDAGYKEFLK
jgi:hypothetical protein